MWKTLASLQKRLTISIPFLAFGLGLWFFPDQPWLALGLLLAGLVYGTVTRNLSIALGFVIQEQAAARYVRLGNAVFGPPEPRDPAN